MPAITLTASYGAGGSVVAPLVATRLGWTLVDRALSSEVAASLQMSVADAERGGSQPSGLTRFLLSLTPFAPTGLLADDQDIADETAVRGETERRLKQAAQTGVVVLGRAGSCALLGEPEVLRVRLFGPPDARVAQGARLEGVDVQEARRRMPQVDDAREDYMRRLYGRGTDDPSLYHLHIDSTVVPLPGVAEIILTAFARLVAR